MNENEGYLRVLKPVTKDGINLQYRNGHPVYDEQQHPLSAEKNLIKQNKRLIENGHNHLVLKIERVDHIDTYEDIAADNRELFTAEQAEMIKQFKNKKK